MLTKVTHMICLTLALTCRIQYLVVNQAPGIFSSHTLFIHFVYYHYSIIPGLVIFSVPSLPRKRATRDRSCTTNKLYTTGPPQSRASSFSISVVNMVHLTAHDTNVLAKIKDPEAGIASRVKIDGSLLPDPNVTGSDYEAAKDIELHAIRNVVKKDRFGFPLEPVSDT